MAGRRPTPPRAAANVAKVDVPDEATARAIEALRDAVQRLQGQVSSQIIEVDLAVGLNVVPHSLGRAVRVVQVTPSVADASFAFALRRSTLLAERQVLIEVVGTAQPGATLLVM